jgi:hypothetical protein
MSGSGFVSAVLAVIVGLATPPPAGDDPIVIRGDNNGGIATTVTDAGSPGSRLPGKAAVPASNGGGVTCTYMLDYSNHSGGWPQEILDGPPADEQGAWYYRECSNGAATDHVGGRGVGDGDGDTGGDVVADGQSRCAGRGVRRAGASVRRKPSPVGTAHELLDDVCAVERGPAADRPGSERPVLRRLGDDDLAGHVDGDWRGEREPAGASPHDELPAGGGRAAGREPALTSQRKGRHP